MQFLNTVNKYISGKEYANKGIRTSDGTLAYVTSTGVTKQISSDSLTGLNCPNEFIDVDQTWQNLGFPVGSLMVNGQSCGNEGTYVRGQPPATDFDWQFYLQNNPDLTAAGFTTEQQANDHWNSNGKSEGRAPNATIFSSMGMVGKVGYIDVDTVFHSVQPTYNNQYTAFPNQSNLTGTAMMDCTTPLPLVTYGSPLVLMQNNQTASVTSSSLLQFGTDSSNLFLRPPPGEDLTGQPVKVGDYVCISTSSSSYTTDCGWWGCKVGTINNQLQLLFDAGGGSPSLFTIVSSKPAGTPLKLSDTFTFKSIPQMNKANLNVNVTVNCSQGQPSGMPAGAFRYSGNNEMNYYPTPDIAASWNTNWSGDVVEADCSTYTFGDTLTMNNGANLNHGQSAYCNSGQDLTNGVNGGVYRFVDNNTLRWYPNPTIAGSWDSNWMNFKSIDCTTYKAGATMSDKMDGNASKELVETPKFAYVSNGVMMFGTTEADGFLFSFQLTNYNPACNIGTLKNACNTSPDCIGFVQAPTNNSWQMITSQTTSGDYKITPTTQDIYVRGADVNLNDDSCEPGPVSFIRGSVLGNYPQGDAFGQGSGQCQVIQAPKYKVKNYVKKASKIVHEFPTNIQYNLEETKIMKEKTNEYKEVLKGIKKMEPSNTLEQQYTDITVFDEQNKKALIVWSVISVSILGFVFFRMKS